MDAEPSSEQLTPEQLATVNLAVDSFYAVIRRRAPQADRLWLVSLASSQLLAGLLRVSPRNTAAVVAALNLQLQSANYRLVHL